MRDAVFARAHVALGWFVTLSSFMPVSGTAAEAPVNILFVGNSFTHARYEPARTYNAGFGADNVHDLMCPSLANCSSAEQGSQIDPAETPPPGTTLNWRTSRPILPRNTTSLVPSAAYPEFSYNLRARRASIIPSQSLR